MIKGRFGNTSGRPYLEGRLSFPRLNISSDISFIVDTGADRSVLNPLDGFRMRLNYASLERRVESLGLGGVCLDWAEKAYVAFIDHKKAVYVYDIEIEVSEPKEENLSIPSILGRDILDRWRMDYNPSARRLSFKVVSADWTMLP